MAEPLNVLIVEDSEDDALLLVHELRREGYDVSYQRVETSDAMSAALSEGIWDIVFADYTMPRFSGTDALELLRTRDLDIPFIFVSGTMGEDTAVEAIRKGANDYLIKGNLKRLVPAIKRELREVEVRRQRKLAEEELKKKEKHIWVFYEINLAITSVLDLPELLDILLQKVDLFLPYSVATVTLFNRERKELEFPVWTHSREVEWQAHFPKCAGILDKRVIETKAPVSVRHVQEEVEEPEKEFCRRHELFSYLGLPLIAKGELLGALGFYTAEEHEFKEEEIRFLSTLANQVAIAIFNAQLYEETRKRAMDLERANKL